MKTVNRFADVLNKNLALLSVLVALFALVVPSFWVNLAGSVNLDLSWVPFMGQHFSSLGFVNLLLGVIMFGMGMTLRAEDFALILRRPGDVLVGICSQYVCMAGFGWLVAKLLSVTGVGGPEACAQIAVGLVLLGCVPGGTASNVMTFLAHHVYHAAGSCADAVSDACAGRAVDRGELLEHVLLHRGGGPAADPAGPGRPRGGG